MCAVIAEKMGCICDLFGKVMHISLERGLFGSEVGPATTFHNLGCFLAYLQLLGVIRHVALG